MAETETETSAPEIPDATRTCRECQTRTAPDEQTFVFSAGVQCVCWRCVARWPDAPERLRARLAIEAAGAALPDVSAALPELLDGGPDGFGLPH